MPFHAVPWLFLVASGVGAAFTLNALWPVQRGRLLVVPAFFASWLTGELVEHHLFWQVVATAVFIALGGLAAWPGWLALGLVGLSWVGLWRLIWQARRTKPLAEEALTEALGDGYGGLLSEEDEACCREPMSLRQRALPLPIYDRRVAIVRDIPFAEYGNKVLRLDIRRPAAGAVGRPVLLQIHGGGWIIGKKEEQGLPLTTRMAAHGWLCVSANYRLSPRATFPDHLIDVKAAIRWVRENIAEHGGDPKRIVLTGGSAGGHLSSLAALTAGDAAYQPGFEDADTSVLACVPFYGVYDFTDRGDAWHRGLGQLLERYILKRRLKEDPQAFERASPIHQVHPGAPPFLIIHGAQDTLAPVKDARRMVQRLREISPQPVAYLELPGAQHAFEVFPSSRTALVLQAVERFLCWVVARDAQQGTALSAGAKTPAPSSKGERPV